MKKKILIISIFLVLLIAGFADAARPVEINYPEINSIKPVTIKTALPKYIKYVFEFFVTISGLICFTALIYGGVMYLTSAGNPGRQSDAISRIQDAFLGAAIVFGAFLISNTINPQLIIPQIGIQPVQGIVSGTDVCNGNEPGGEIKTIAKDSADFGTMEDGTPFIARSIKFASRPGELKVILYNGTNYNHAGKSILELTSDFQNCINLNTFGVESAQSVKFFWQIPGVYLCTDVYNGESICQGEEKYLGADTALLDNDFNDKIKAIRLQPSYTTVDFAIANAADCEANVAAGGLSGEFWEKEGRGYCTYPVQYFGLVLHEHADFSGQCEIFQFDKTSLKNIFNLASDSNTIGADTASSITIFAEPALSFTSPTGGVWLCEETNPQRPISASDNPQKCHGRDNSNPTLGFQHWVYAEFSEDQNVPNDSISSIIIDGEYLVALFDEGRGGIGAYKGKCEVFTRSDSNFRDNPMGRCTCIMGNWGCADCLSSFIIIPTKQ